MNLTEVITLPRVLQPEPGDWHEDAFVGLDDPLLDQLREPRDGGCGGRFPVDSLGLSEGVPPGEDVGFLNRSGRAFSGLDSRLRFLRGVPGYRPRCLLPQCFRQEARREDPGMPR